MASTVIRKGDPIQKEQTAGEDLTPGELVEFASDGDLQAHSTAGEEAQARFVREHSEIGNDIDTDYSSGDTAKYVVGRKGDEIEAFITANESDVSKGDFLESDGSGNLQLADDGGASTSESERNSKVVVAAEDVTSIGSSRERITVEVV